MASVDERLAEHISQAEYNAEQANMTATVWQTRITDLKELQGALQANKLSKKQALRLVTLMEQK